jgi:diguanylate cyclase (GGDEF)-like protein
VPHPARTHIAMLVALTTYLVALLVPVLHLDGWVADAVLAQVVLLLAAVVLGRRSGRYREERVWLLPLAIGVSLLLLGRASGWVDAAWRGVAFPQLSDAGRLGGYPFLLLALLLALHSRLRGVRPVVMLDAVASALAAGAVGAWVVVPLVEAARDAGVPQASQLPELGYAVCGVVVAAASLGALGLLGTARGWPFVMWTVGTTVVGAAAVAHAYCLLTHSRGLDSWLEAIGPAGVAMVVLGVTHAAVPPRRALPRERSLAVVAASSVASVAVLAAGPTWSDHVYPTALALCALVACGLRLSIAFLQLRELAAMREQALTDELTGAANRRALYAELDRVFVPDLDGDGVDGADGRTGFALGLIDLDHFKEVNDSYGHAAGDELLRSVVQRFSRALERLATPHLFARLGGDEFAVLLHEVDTREAAMLCGEALQESLVEPVVIDDVVLQLHASIGMALAPGHARNRSDILYAADAAMYASKTSGEPVCLSSPDDGSGRGTSATPVSAA